MRNQPAGMFDQMFEDRKGFRCQQDARLLPGIGAPPETLVRGIEPEGGKYFHRLPTGPSRPDRDLPISPGLTRFLGGGFFDLRSRYSESNEHRCSSTHFDPAAQWTIVRGQ
jgi:hypothetical protein